jgi:hypothetical protein
MVPEEWPIAAEPADQMVDFAPARGPSRLTTVRRDFFLDPAERLTEQERALMTAMLHDLVSALAASISVEVGDPTLAAKPSRIATSLARAGLLDRPGLIRLMLRRADEHRIMAAFAGQSGPRRLPLLPNLIADDDPAIAGPAMVLVVARGRRRDGFGQPRVDLSDLEIDDTLALAHAVAVTICPAADADARFATAASAVAGAINRDEALDGAVAALLEALDRAGRADEAFIEAASGEGEVALVAQILRLRTGIEQPAVWDHLINAGEGALALVTRMAGLGRRGAARLIADLGSFNANCSIEQEISRYDGLSAAEVAAALQYWRLPPDYRAALSASGGRRG